MIDPDVKYNILSIDGGPAAPVQIRLLRKIEEKFPGFLAATDMFTGTSDGAMLAAFLASRLPKNNDQAKLISLDVLDDAIQFSNLTIHALQPRPWSFVRFVTGVGPLIESKRLEAVLQHAFGSMKVKDLERLILITAYDCNKWKMANFTNVKHISYQADALLYEAILASAALPMYAPVYQGSSGTRFLDGVFVANNPSLLAAGTLLNSVWLDNHFAENTTEWQQLVARLRVLSLGLGEVNATYQRPIDSIPTLWQQACGTDWRQHSPFALKWGWWQWLVQRPTLLASILHHSQSGATKLECEMFLAPMNHHRYTPPSETITVVIDVARRNADNVIQAAERCVEDIWTNYADLTVGFGSDNHTSNMLKFVDKRWMKKAGEEESLSDEEDGAHVNPT